MGMAEDSGYLTRDVSTDGLESGAGGDSGGDSGGGGGGVLLETLLGGADDVAAAAKREGFGPGALADWASSLEVRRAVAGVRVLADAQAALALSRLRVHAVNRLASLALDPEVATETARKAATVLLAADAARVAAAVPQRGDAGDDPMLAQLASLRAELYHGLDEAAEEWTGEDPPAGDGGDDDDDDPPGGGGPAGGGGGPFGGGGGGSGGGGTPGCARTTGGTPIPPEKPGTSGCARTAGKMPAPLEEMPAPPGETPAPAGETPAPPRHPASSRRSIRGVDGGGGLVAEGGVGAGELHLDHAAVDAAGGHELVMGAALADPAVGQDQDLVGMGDRAQAVGDDEARPALHQVAEARLDQPFALGVEVAGGLVEDEDPRVGIQGPGDGEALALAAGEADAALSDEGVVALGQVGDEAVGVGELGGGDDPRRCPRKCPRNIRGGGPTPGGRGRVTTIGGTSGGGGVSSGGGGVGDVVGDGAVEEEDVLLDDAEESAVGLDVDGAEVGAVEGDAAGGGVVEAGDEVAEGGLAGPAGANEGDGLAGQGFEVDVLEDPLVGAGGIGSRRPASGGGRGRLPV